MQICARQHGRHQPRGTGRHFFSVCNHVLSAPHLHVPSDHHIGWHRCRTFSSQQNVLLGGADVVNK